MVRNAESSVDAADVARFEKIGREWWSERGPMAALHQLNPLRIGFIRDRLAGRFATPENARDVLRGRPLEGLRLLDIGCGGGILSEPLTRLGATMVSIDPAPGNVEVARWHAAQSGLEIDYRATTAEALVEAGESFDAVLAMEVVEHVVDPAAFIGTCCRLVRPGGMLMAATLNRTLKSFALGIVAAEYVLRWVERGTHDWNKFVRPEELEDALRAGGCEIVAETGVVFDPLRGIWKLSRDMDVNYMVAAVRPS